MILFITNKEDITTDFVVQRIQESGTDYYRLNTEDLFNTIDICFDFGVNKFEIIDERKGIIEFDKIRSVYFRRPKLPCTPPKLDIGEKKFILSEYDSLLNGIYSTLSNKRSLQKVDTRRKLFSM